MVVADIDCVCGAGFPWESHFAFLAIAKRSQTPVRRQLDYLRRLGASKEGPRNLAFW